MSCEGRIDGECNPCRGSNAKTIFATIVKHQASLPRQSWFPHVHASARFASATQLSTFGFSLPQLCARRTNRRKYIHVRDKSASPRDENGTRLRAINSHVLFSAFAGDFCLVKFAASSEKPRLKLGVSEYQKRHCYFDSPSRMRVHAGYLRISCAGI